jgi:ATP-dependent exoDNAse (exonuclease V) beta subunit
MLKLKPLYDVQYIDDMGHYYVIAGKKYGSVTSILNIIGGQKTAALQGWSKKVALNYVSDELKNNLGQDVIINEAFIDKVVKAGKQQPAYETAKAADYGTRAHTAIDEYIVNGKMPNDEQIMPSFNGFLTFLKEHKMNIISGDITLGSKKYGFGGRADGIAIDKEGNYIIIDFKTSNYMSPDYYLQVAAYAWCFSEQYGVPLPKKCYIIKFGKDSPSYEIAEVDNVEYYFKAFLAAKDLKEAIESIQKSFV